MLITLGYYYRDKSYSADVPADSDADVSEWDDVLSCMLSSLYYSKEAAVPKDTSYSIFGPYSVGSILKDLSIPNTSIKSWHTSVALL